MAWRSGGVTLPHSAPALTLRRARHPPRHPQNRVKHWHVVAFSSSNGTDAKWPRPSDTLLGGGGPAAGHCLLPLGPASRSCRRAPVRPRPPTAGLGDLETGAGEPCGLDVSPFQFRFASRRLVLKCRRCDFSGKSAALTLCPPGVLSGGTRSLCHTAWRPPGPLDSRPRLPGLTVRPPAACVVWSVRGVRFETR